MRSCAASQEKRISEQEESCEKSLASGWFHSWRMLFVFGLTDYTAALRERNKTLDSHRLETNQPIVRDAALVCTRFRRSALYVRPKPKCARREAALSHANSEEKPTDWSLPHSSFAHRSAGRWPGLSKINFAASFAPTTAESMTKRGVVQASYS